MYAIASLFDPESDTAVRQIWDRFEAHCGFTGMNSTPLPHLSWVGADSFLFQPVEEGLRSLSAEVTGPLKIITSGIGIFTGPNPVVYISVVKSPALFNLHRIIWETARPFAVVVNRHYHPDRWIPHITLAYHPLEPSQFGCAISDVAFQRISLEIELTSLAVITNNQGQGGVHSQFMFQKEG